MPSLKNENILSTLITSFAMKEATHLVKQVKNATFNKLLLRYINYEDIFKSLKTAQVILRKGGLIKNSIVLLHNGNMVSFDNYEIKIFNTTNFECVKILKDDQPIKSGIILPNGDILTCNSNRFKIWEVNNDFKCIIIDYEKSQEIKDFNNLFLLGNGNITCLAYNNDTACIAVFDKNLNFVKDITLNSYPWYLVFANINNNRFVFSSFQFLEVRNLDDYKCLQVKAEENDYIGALLSIEKNDLLLSSSATNDYLKVWNTNNFHCIKIIQITRPVCKLLSLPCGFVVCGFVNYSDQVSLEIWNIDKGELINSFKGNHGIISSLIYKDNRIILKYVDNGILKWDY
jgi:WD40 repeat protein